MHGVDIDAAGIVVELMAFGQLPSHRPTVADVTAPADRMPADTATWSGVRPGGCSD